MQTRPAIRLTLNRRFSRKATRSGVIGALLIATACGSVADEGPLETRGQAVIGGAHANSSVLDHTGALVAVDPTTGTLSPFCSSTLIGPETVVTSKNCVAGFNFIVNAGYQLGWAVGPDARSPVELIPVAAADTAPGLVGGYIDMGRDVGIIHLEDPTAIEPAVPRLVPSDWAGASMVAIGYGVHRAAGTGDQQRRMGRQTIAGIEGRIFELLLGSFENYAEWSITREVTPDDFLETFVPEDATVLETLRKKYETWVLYDRHEVVTGTAPSDARVCHGDAGGPLARVAADGSWETYGVVSGGISSTRSVCDFGTVYATFGPETLEFLEQSLAWVDPCGDVTARGECSGNVAHRCESSFHSQIRRVVEEDCSAAGLECVSSEAGTGCGGAPPVAAADAGALESLLEGMRESYFPAEREF